MNETLNNPVVQPTSKGTISKIVHILDKIVNPLCKAGAAIACVMLAAMMFLTFFDVAGAQLGKLTFINSRTSFFQPILGSQEITELLMVILVSFALAYTALNKGHVRVDILMQYTSKRTNYWFDIFAYGFSCIFYILIAWQSWIYAIDNIADKAVSTILFIPIYPFNFLLVIGAIIVALELLRDFFKSIEEVKQ